MSWVGNPHYTLHRGETGNPRLRGSADKGPFQHKHPKTDNSRWTLTTGAVGAPPAGLTLTGVWSNAATMDTFICTVGCRREKSIKWGALAQGKPPNNTAVSHPGLKYHLKTTCTLDNFLQSMPQPSCSLRWNQTIPLPILIAPSKFLHFCYLTLLHATLGKKFQGKLPNPVFKKMITDDQIYPLCFGRWVCGCECRGKAQSKILAPGRPSRQMFPCYLHQKQQLNPPVHMLFTTTHAIRHTRELHALFLLEENIQKMSPRS